MKAKFLTVFLSLIVLFSATQSTFAATTFKDVKGTLHEESILQLNERGLIGGYPDGTFRPDEPLTRDQAIRLLGRYLVKVGYNVPEDFASEVRFEDIPLKSDSELLRLTSMLYEEGVFVGTNGYLEPKSQMQRQHMALVLVRIIHDFANVDLIADANKAGHKSAFNDIQKVNNSVAQAILALEYAGISSGKSFYPTKPVTRGEFATFLNRLVNVMDEAKAAQQMEQELQDELADSQQQETISDEQQQAEPSIDFQLVKAITLKKDTPLYASRNLMNETAIWKHEETEIAATYLTTDDVFVIKVGEEKYYVASKYVTAAQAEQRKSVKAIGAVRTIAPYEVKIATNGPVVFIGSRSHKMMVLGVEGNYYKVQLGQTTGYIHKEDTFVNTRKNVKLVQDESVINHSNGKVMTKLTAGTTLKVNKVVNGKAQFSGGNVTYVVDSGALVETDTVPTIIYPALKHAYPVTVTAKVNTLIYGNDGQEIGEIKAGSKVQVKGIVNGKGAIDYLGGSALISLNQFKHSNIVTPSRNISYSEADFYVQVLHYLYPDFTELELIGKSVEGRNIHALKVGTGKKLILLDASTHAREHMTTNVLMEMIDQYTVAYANKTKVGKYDARSILSKVSIWFVPMVNPDGVTLVQYGPSAMKNPAQVKQINKNSSNFGRWKANARGVDLNRNFDARWSGITTRTVSWDMYRGPSPFSEPESKALGEFMLKYPFKTNLAFHSSGQIIFWGHNAQNKTRNANLARLIASTTGHSLIKSSQTAPTGASASYFSIKTGMPSMTVEIAPYAGNAPVPLSRWNDVWKRMQYVGLVAATEANSR